MSGSCVLAATAVITLSFLSKTFFIFDDIKEEFFKVSFPCHISARGFYQIFNWVGEFGMISCDNGS